MLSLACLLCGSLLSLGPNPGFAPGLGLGQACAAERPRIAVVVVASGLRPDSLNSVLEAGAPDGPEGAGAQGQGTRPAGSDGSAHQGSAPPGSVEPKASPAGSGQPEGGQPGGPLPEPGPTALSDGAFSQRGLRRLLREGVRFLDARVDHAPSMTAPGCATIATGAQPCDHGIPLDSWIGSLTGSPPGGMAGGEAPREVLAWEEAGQGLVVPGRSLPAAGPGEGVGPAALAASTLADELVLSTALGGKAWSFAASPAAAVFTAGRLGKALWFSRRTGTIASSTWYFPTRGSFPARLPRWLDEAVASRELDPSTLAGGAAADHAVADLLVDAAVRAIREESLGKDSSPDLLYLILDVDPESGEVRGGPPASPGPGGAGSGATSASASAWASGAQGPPRSLLALDRAVERLLDALSGALGAGAEGGGGAPRESRGTEESRGIDASGGEGPAAKPSTGVGESLSRSLRDAPILVVLVAERGAPPPILRSEGIGLPAGVLDPSRLAAKVKAHLDRSVRPLDWVLGSTPGGIWLNPSAVEASRRSPGEIEDLAAAAVRTVEGVAEVYTRSALLEGRLRDGEVPRRLRRSFVPGRFPSVLVVPRPYFVWARKAAGEGSKDDPGEKSGETKSGERSRPSVVSASPHAYDTHVPLVFFGCGLAPRSVARRVSLVDVAPTLAVLLGVGLPSACSGEPLREVVER